MTTSIAIGSIFIECNHFGGVPADIESFRRSELFYDAELLDRTAGTVGGMLSVLRERSVMIRPLLVASACPSGPVTADCYRQLKREMLDRLQAALPVNGVLLALHGSAAVEGIGDLEGDLLSAVRAMVGDTIPVVATLDLHAHVTAAMIRSADALIAWETYPHKDAFTTGERGAIALLDILDGKLRPAMAMAKVPVLVSGVLGHTEMPGPFAETMRLAKSFESLDDVYSTSAFLVHPYLDLPDMGGGGLVITNGNLDQAERLARQVAELYWQKRFELEPPVFLPADAIAHGLRIEGGPVLLVETSDCCGGGAAGDSAASLRALLAAGVDQQCLIPIVDPAAAAKCHAAGEGAVVSVLLGHHVDPKWGEPIAVTGVIRKLSDGAFRYRGGIWDGQAGHMGPSAALHVGKLQIAVASHGTYEWCGEQYELLDLDARSSKFIVVKNPMNYSMAYGEIAKGEFILNTPGPTPATLRGTPFKHVRRPYYPADAEIPGLQPTILRGVPRFIACDRLHQPRVGGLYTSPGGTT